MNTEITIALFTTNCVSVGNCEGGGSKERTEAGWHRSSVNTVVDEDDSMRQSVFDCLHMCKYYVGVCAFMCSYN